MRVLTINTGSSSLKFQVSEVLGGESGRTSVRGLVSGKVENIGGDSRFSMVIGGKAPVREAGPVSDHGQAVREALSRLKREGFDFEAVGHRIVHGGGRYHRPAVVGDEVVREIEAAVELAPLHNPLGLAGIRACREALGAQVPMVAVFDTAFHAGLPLRASAYAIPRELADRHRIRRYGFHGIAHGYLARRYVEMTGAAEEETRLITLHLGHGCSAAAIRGGRCIDTSMGFTPLEGLVMGTRSGDLDPAIVAYLAEKEGTAAAEVVGWLNHRSGLAGLSGIGGDVRTLLGRREADAGARLALEVFCYRAKKYVGAYLAALSGADALIFSGGIGENAAEVREEVCRDMEWCGLVLDSERNRRADGREMRISREGAACGAYVIPVNEESVIARETYGCLAGGGKHAA